MSPSRSSAAGVADVLLGLGGNLGDPAAAIATALDRLAAGGLRILARSSLYRTAPWGVADQPDFINACALAQTELAPHPLLERIHAVERALGRERRERWGPRTIDIDILDYDGVALDDSGLMLPHPRLTERAFVLVPLAEIAPDRVIAGRTVREWAAEIDRSGITRL
jgi:2-amino-4-hydroxy-6-hydroxymethyldihydropteridine diphosphokinase